MLMWLVRFLFSTESHRLCRYFNAFTANDNGDGTTTITSHQIKRYVDHRIDAVATFLSFNCIWVASTNKATKQWTCLSTENCHCVHFFFFVAYVLFLSPSVSRAKDAPYFYLFSFPNTVIGYFAYCFLLSVLAISNLSKTDFFRLNLFVCICLCSFLFKAFLFCDVAILLRFMSLFAHVYERKAHIRYAINRQIENSDYRAKIVSAIRSMFKVAAKLKVETNINDKFLLANHS